MIALKKIKLFKYGLTLFLALCTVMVFAQSKLSVSLSKTTVAANEPFEVTFSVNNNGTDFTPPSFPGLQVISGPNTSSSMTMINGATTMSLGFSYDLVAPQPGEYTIGPASIVVNGKHLSSSAVRIKVVKGSPQSARQQQQQQAQGGGAPGGSMATPEQAKDISKLCFIRASVDREKVVQGDQLVLTFKLYTRIPVETGQVDKAPDFTGFWNEDIKLPPNLQPTQEIFNGQRFDVALIKQVILFPDHSGDISVDPLEMTFLVKQPVASNDPFDQFFGNSAFKDVKYKAKSNKIVVHVKPLPTAGQPAGFAGAVGKFTVSTSIDKKELKANESLNYQVKVTGSGNIKLMKAPTITFPTDFEKYDPKVTDSTHESLAGVTGYRVYSYLLIPRHQGDYKIDPLSFSYFNPATNRYQTVTAPGFKIKVNKGVAQAVTTVAADQGDAKKLGTDIRPLKTGLAYLSKDEAGFLGSTLFYILLALGPIGFLIAWWYRGWLARYNSDVVKVRSRKASKLAAKYLSSAQKQLKAGNSKAFYEDVFRGLYGYLSGKLNIPVADLSRENIAAELAGRKISEQTSAKLLEALDQCEMARYAPVPGISEKEMFERAQDIINDIEDEI